MKKLGMALVVLGALALVYGIRDSRTRTIGEIGSLQVTATRQGVSPWPTVGGIAVLGGLVLLGLPRRRLAPVRILRTGGDAHAADARGDLS